MQPGNLNQRITLYKQVISKSPSGAPLTELTFDRNAWAKVTYTGSSTSDAGDREQLVQRFDVTLFTRRGKTVSFGDWLKYRDSWIKVVGVDDTDPYQSVLVLSCESNPNEIPPPLTEATQ